MKRHMRLLLRLGREVRVIWAVYSHAVARMIGMARAR